ncbi:MAG: amidase [Chloroflexi bacterium]|nr:amidase [Chloroflexota bacterium]|tara:strand:+ start:33955 stop:35397 length:1443 start_codon:yes stop_codon:yes gene_type:complete
MKDEIYYQDATSLARLIKKKVISPVEIFDLLEKRISKLNPDLNAIIQFPDDSRIKAKEAENDLYTKDKLAIFHGVPFTVKDCIDTQGILTTRGSKIFSSNRPNKDATVVKRMKDSGAILIGKTNMPEFALWWETANSLYGKTENPWSIGKTPGGSSGGEASAISAGLSPFGIGSDLGGSIRQPAAFCGIVGFKPSHGRVPLTGHWPNTLLRFMHVGPLSRSVRDIINGLIIMSGNDGNDYYSLKLPRFDFEHKNLDVKNIKVAYCYDGPFNPVSQEVKSNISRASEVFKDMGANVERVFLEDWVDIDHQVATSKIYAVEGGFYLNSIIGENFNKLSPVMKRRLLNKPPTLDEYLDSLKKVEELRGCFTKLFSEYDILLCPVSPTVAYKHDPINHNGNDLNFNPPYLDVDGEIIEGRNSIGATIPADLSGFPAISLPFGFSNKGLPIGVQLIGRYAEDSSLLGLSLCFESHTKGIKNYPYD